MTSSGPAIHKADTSDFCEASRASCILSHWRAIIALIVAGGVSIAKHSDFVYPRAGMTGNSEVIR